MVLFVQNKWVWLEHPRHVYLPVQMNAVNGSNIIARSAEGEVFEIPVNKELGETHPGSLVACENMVTMSELSEAAILHNLRLRYASNDIYTYISSILLSMNPYKMLPIYSPSVIGKFRQLSQKREPLPPHVFSIADFAFTNMEQERTNQSVVISGESGSGKTEATKLILQYLAECSGHSDQVEEQILEANPIIEAFGNAKTGKWIKIAFNNLKINGAFIESYLLERTRVVSQSPGERNYHIFYQFCAGASAEEKQMFGLTTPDKFRYLCGGNSMLVEGVSDEKEWKHMRTAMNTLNFTSQEQVEIFSALAAVMHLGNVTFQQVDEASKVENPQVIELIAKILKVDAAALEKSLISRKIKVSKELVVADNTKLQAEDTRDAFSKYLYDKLFDFLIYRINQTLSTGAPSQAFIGVLDIFGFEMFDTNRFEQLCINFANEKLQQHFNHHIFSMEQEEYKNDGLNIPKVDFIDNQACLDVIEKRPIGIFSMVDEELKLPKGSDSNLLTRMHKEYEKNKYYVKPRTAKPVFSINHYAGEVTYVIEGFLDKNKDQLSEDALDLIKSSSIYLVSKLVDNAFNTSQSNSLSSPTATLSRQKTMGVGGGIAANTVSAQFKEQLTGLMKTLNATNPQFVRCIKPNEHKIADTFDANFVIRQLRYLGIKEVVNIRQLGYPMRRTLNDFVTRYKMLTPIPQGSTDLGKSCKAIFNSIEMPDDYSMFAIGRTKVFLKTNTSTLLEKSREQKTLKLVIKLQARIKGWIYRKRYLRIKKVLDQLKAAIAKPEESIDKMEEAIALATEMRIRVPLIEQAKQVLARTKEILQMKKALANAVASKEISVLQAAISRATEIKIDPSFSGFIAAKELLAALEAHDKNLTIAIKGRDLEGLKAGLENAKKLGIFRDLEKQAESLVNRLETEAKAKQAVDAAVESKDIARLKTAIAGAADIGYDYPQLEDARKLLSVLEEQKKVVESLQCALKSQNLGLLERSLADASKCPSTAAIVDLMSQCSQLQSTLLSQAKEQDLMAGLSSAINSGDFSLIESAIKKAVDGGMGSNPLVGQAKDMLVKMQEELGVESLLSKALTSRSLSSLENAIHEAQKKNATNSASFDRAVAMAENFQKIFGEIDVAIRNSDLEALEKALGKAIQSGLNEENNDVIKSGNNKKNQLVEQNSVAKALESAIASGDESLLKSTLERSKACGLTSSNALVAQASAELGRMIAQRSDEAALKEREEAAKLEAAEAMTSTVVYEDAKQEDIPVPPPPSTSTGQPAHVTLNLEKVSRPVPAGRARGGKRGSVIFNPSSYMEDKYGLQLYPKLKTEDEYVRGKLFGRGALKATMLSWNKEVIPNAITKLNENLEKDALYIFKSILGFMGDRHYSFPDTLASEVLERGLTNESLRDEIFVQLMKQMTFNGKPESLVRGWMLLGLAVETFLPSMVLLPYVLRFIKDHIDNEVGGITVPLRKEYAQYCLKTVQKTFHLPPKLEAPSIEHVTAFQGRVMLGGSARVHFLDGSYVNVDVDPAILVNQTIDFICEEIELNDSHGFAIYEVAKNQTDRYIMPHECLLDFEAFKKPGNSRFVFKKRLFAKNVMPISHDPVNLQLVYHQAAFEIWSNNLILGVDTTVELYALNMLLEAEKQTPYITSDIDEQSPFVPKMAGIIPTSLKLSAKLSQNTFTEMVKARAQKLESASISKYLEVIFKHDQFGCQFFTVQQDENPNFPKHMSVGVNKKGIFFFNWETHELAGSFGFDVISGWTDTPLLFVTRVFDKIKNKLETLALQTTQGKLITNCLQAYVEVLMAEMKLQQ